MRPFVATASRDWGYLLYGQGDANLSREELRDLYDIAFGEGKREGRAEGASIVARSIREAMGKLEEAIRNMR